MMGRWTSKDRAEHPPDLVVWLEKPIRRIVPMRPKRPVRDIDKIAERETAAYLRRASITYLECCVSLMMTHLQREEVATILEQEADMLRNLD
ncbi:hypothetical protein [Mesorhizobium opportunistum]|uniref:Uncharacterized protein n=2 Tax=Phyllobacteriaceae TaxID=69277 RepID=A0ABV1YLJ3_9HYPH